MQLHRLFKDWLIKRGITENVLTDFDITSNDYLNYGECIYIPVTDLDGNFSFNKYRRSPLLDDPTMPKYLYDKGSKATLYGFHKAKDEPKVLITEGELDTLVSWSANIPAVSSTGGALSFREEWGPLFADKEVVLCFDNDKAGGEGMVRAYNYLKDYAHVSILFLPDEQRVSDISDFVGAGGDLHALMKGAKHFEGIDDVLEDKGRREGVWQSTHFHDAFEKEYRKIHLPKLGNASESTDELERAKAFPIPDLVTFRQGKAKCVWHKEKTGSMHYYPENNRVYCYGCSRHGDAIDVYMTINNCTFKEAIKKLQ